MNLNRLMLFGITNSQQLIGMIFFDLPLIKNTSPEVLCRDLLETNLTNDNCMICNRFHHDIFWWFCDVTKENSHASIKTLYRELLGEVVFCYDNVYKIEKALSIVVRTFEDFWSAFLLEVDLHCPKPLLHFFTIGSVFKTPQIMHIFYSLLKSLPFFQL